MNVKKELFISILVSGLLGALVWAFSPYATGFDEPWDAETPYYIICLFSTGFITGVLCPRNIWAVLLGVVMGQLLYLYVFLPLGPLVSVGIIFMIVYGFLAVFGAFAGARARQFLKEYLAGVKNRA